MSRSTAIQWRQGDMLLSAGALQGTGVSIDSNTIAIVISHDCDIANNEPDVELIIGCFITKDEFDGNNAFAKNPRILHIEIGKSEKFIEFKANKKFLLSKDTLMNYKPDIQYVLTSNQRNTLQDWLSVRYKRQAIPDALKDRLNPLWSFLIEKGKKNNQNVLGYWMQYDPENEELNPHEAYDFSLFIIYSIDNIEYEKEARSLANQIKEKFMQFSTKTALLGTVRLLECEAYSEQEFTLRDMRQNIQYRFDYLSHRTDPHGPVI